MTLIEEVTEVYLAYPRHTGKEAALKAIQKAAARLVKSKEHPDEQAARRWLWKKATQYARSPAGQKPPAGCQDDFRPHPATWFNQGRYFDDVSEWLKPNGVSSNGRAQHRSTTKADRTAESLYSVLNSRPGEDRSGTRSNGHLQGRRGVSNLFEDDERQVVEGRR